MRLAEPLVGTVPEGLPAAAVLGEAGPTFFLEGTAAGVTADSASPCLGGGGEGKCAEPGPSPVRVAGRCLSPSPFPERAFPGWSPSGRCKGSRSPEGAEAAGDPSQPHSCFRATIDEVETDVVEIEAKLDKVKGGPGAPGARPGLGMAAWPNSPSGPY